MSSRTVFVLMSMVLMGALPADAATISGVVTDTSGAAVVGTRVVVRDVATRQGIVAQTGEDGRYTVEAPTPGTYLVSVAREGFSETVQTVIVDRAEQVVDVPLRLQVGTVTSAVVVTASRAERDTRRDPAPRGGHHEGGRGTVQPTLHGRCPDHGGQHHARRQRSLRCPAAPARPGLNAPAGAGRRRAAEHGTSGDRSHGRRGGAGLAGFDQPDGGRQWRRHADVRVGCAGRHHQHHHERSRVHAPGRSGCMGSTASTAPTRTACVGRGTAGVAPRTHRAASRRAPKTYDNYKAGDLDSEDTRPLFASGGIHQADTIDDNFGFHFNSVSRSVQRAVRANRATRCSTRRPAGTSSTSRAASRSASGRSGPRAIPAARGWKTSGFPGFRRAHTSSTRHRCRTATSTGCRPATRRRRSRPGWPTCR